MRIVAFGERRGEPIEGFESVGAAAPRLGSGSGEGHAYVFRFEAGGAIGLHEAAFGQLFLVIEGSGWVEEGSERGMVAVMVQVRDFMPAEDALKASGS